MTAWHRYMCTLWHASASWGVAGEGEGEGEGEGGGEVLSPSKLTGGRRCQRQPRWTGRR